MSHSPKVSVCIPSYNHARYLSATIESVLAQTFRDFEIVIVDDGSTDESLEIAQSYATRHADIIRVFTHAEKRNLGISATVNRAFAEVRGEYWMGVPSDDLLYPDKLALQVKFLDEHPEVGWVYSYGSFIDGSGKMLDGSEHFGKDLTRERDPLAALIQENMVPGMAVLMRQEVSAKVGPQVNLVYGDWEYWVRMLVCAPVAFIDRPLVYYRVHDRNTSLAVSLSANRMRGVEVMQSLKQKAEAIGGALMHPRIRALIELQIAYLFFSLDRHPEARVSLAAAFQVDNTLLHDSRYLTDWLRRRTQDDWFINADEPPQPIDFAAWMAENLPSEVTKSVLSKVEAARWATVAVKNYRTDLHAARRAALRCALIDPVWLSVPSLRAVLLRAGLGGKLLGFVRSLKS